MKVAVLMVGHIKHSIINENYKWIIFKLLKRYSCDLFVFTNNTYSFRNCNEEPAQVDIQKFYDIYKPYIKKIIVEDCDNPNLHTLLDDMLIGVTSRYKHIKDTEKWTNNASINPVFSKLFFINHIKNEYASKNNINYDYVIYIRPEIEITDYIDFDKLQKNTIYGSEWYAFGDNNAMNLYCEKVLHYYKFYQKNNKNSISMHVQNKLFLKNIGNIKYILKEKYFSVQLPFNAYKYLSNISQKEIKNTSNNIIKNGIFHSRVFFVIDFRSRNKFSGFVLNYKQLSDDYISQFKKKYSELFVQHS